MPTGVYIRTENIRKSLALAAKKYYAKNDGYWKGKKFSITARKKMSEAAKKRVGSLNHFFGKKHTNETKIKIGLSKLGKKQSIETITRRAKKLRGKKRTEETRRKMSDAQKGNKGNNWKGGLEPANKRIHHSLDYRIWRERIFKRDDYTCQKCKKRGMKGVHIDLHPHHIKGFAHYPQLRFVINNGITLCVKCHREFHKQFGDGKNHHKYLNKWIKI